MRLKSTFLWPFHHFLQQSFNYVLRLIHHNWKSFYYHLWSKNGSNTSTRSKKIKVKRQRWTHKFWPPETSYKKSYCFLFSPTLNNQNYGFYAHVTGNKEYLITLNNQYQRVMPICLSQTPQVQVYVSMLYTQKKGYSHVSLKRYAWSTYTHQSTHTISDTTTLVDKTSNWASADSHHLYLFIPLR